MCITASSSSLSERKKERKQAGNYVGYGYSQATPNKRSRGTRDGLREREDGDGVSITLLYNLNI